MKKTSSKITPKAAPKTSSKKAVPSVLKSASLKEEHEYETVLLPSGSSIYLTLVHVPGEIAEVFKNAGVKRVVACLISEAGEHEYQCGLMPLGDGKTGIMINKTIRTKLRIGEGSRLFVRLRADDSEYGLEMPEELAELMRQDEEGDRLFHALTKGKQRTLIYVVVSQKKSDRRIERAILVIEHLKEHHEKIDYKRLYDDMKVSKRYEE